MNTTVAFNMFARAILREKHLQFEVITETDLFYSESNLAHLRRGVAADTLKPCAEGITIKAHLV